MAKVEHEIFLRGPKSTLWLEAFFQYPAHSKGRRMGSGEKHTVRDRDHDPTLIIHLTPCVDSDIIHVNALGTSIIILNSYKAANDLLEQRSSAYSSR